MSSPGGMDEDSATMTAEEEQLVGMGFLITSVRSALRRTGQDVNRAIAALVDDDELDVHGPPPLIRRDSTGSTTSTDVQHDSTFNQQEFQDVFCSSSETNHELQVVGQEMRTLSRHDGISCLPRNIHVIGATEDTDDMAADDDESSLAPPRYDQVVPVTAADTTPSPLNSTKDAPNNKLLSGVPPAIHTTQVDNDADDDDDDDEEEIRYGNGHLRADRAEALADSAMAKEETEQDRICRTALTVPEDGFYRFPEAVLVDLESRIFRERWSVPVQLNESLAICVRATTLLCQMPHFSSDEACARFLRSAMPVSFEKVLDTNEVTGWAQSILSKIMSICCEFVPLAVAMIPHDNVLVMETFAKMLSPSCRFHFRNQGKEPSLVVHPDISYAYSSRCNYGWLVDLINQFGNQGGFAAIRRRLQTTATALDQTSLTSLDEHSMVAAATESDAAAQEAEAQLPFSGVADPTAALTAPVTGETLAALLKPFSVCSEYLTPVADRELAHIRQLAMGFIRGQNVVEMAGRDYDAISQCMEAIKKTAPGIERQQVDQFRLDIAAKLLTSKTFAGKMNALKEVNRLCSEAHLVASWHTDWLNTAKMVEWLQAHDVIKTVLRGNLHQSQYVKRVEDLILFQLQQNKLSLDELDSVWDAQVGQHDAVVSNIHDLLAKLAWHFKPEQLNHLLDCFKKSWGGSHKVMHDLLDFIERLAKDDHDGKMAKEVLELLWDLAHAPDVPTDIVERALTAHVKILAAYHITEATRTLWMKRCIDDLVQGVMVVPALLQLEAIGRIFASRMGYPHSTTRQDALRRLDTDHELNTKVTDSLLQCMKRAVQAVRERDSAMSEEDVLATIAGRYSHHQCIDQHLRFLKFLLQEGQLYLGFASTRKVWQATILQPATQQDVATGFEWFENTLSGEADIGVQVQCQLFADHMLQVNPTILTTHGFEVFRLLFLEANKETRALTVYSTTNTIVVHERELKGLDYLWKVALEVENSDIANLAVEFLKTIYSAFSSHLHLPKLHFIDECMTRINRAYSMLTNAPGQLDQGMEEAVAAAGEEKGTIIAAAADDEGVAKEEMPPSKRTLLLVIERCLQLIENYLRSHDETYTRIRCFMPHKLSFRGDSIKLTFQTVTSPKATFIVLAHTNQPLTTVRAQVADIMSWTESRTIITYNGARLTNKMEGKRLCELGVTSDATFFAHQAQVTSYQYNYSNTYSSSSMPLASSLPASTALIDCQPRAAEEEQLPSVQISLQSAYMERLFELAEIPESGIHHRARLLLQELPTEPAACTRLQLTCAQAAEERHDALDGGAAAPLPEGLAIVLPVEQLSPFRLCYYLEVIHGLLLPSLTTDEAQVLTFRMGFIASDGLDFLLRVLQQQSPPGADTETTNKCYSIALSLFRLLLTHALSSSSSTDAIKTTIATSQANGTSINPDDSRMMVEDLDFELREARLAAAAAKALGSNTNNNQDSSDKDNNTTANTTNTTVENDSEEEAATDNPNGAEFPEADCVGPAFSCSMSLEGVSAILAAARFEEVIPALLRLAWAGAMGRLEQNEEQLVLGSPVGEPLTAQAKSIATEALSLLQMVLIHQPRLFKRLYGFPRIHRLIQDCLIGSADPFIRVSSAKLFLSLAMAAGDADLTEVPLVFFIQTLTTSRLPFWHSGGAGHHRGAISQLPAHSLEYFKLLALLLQRLQATCTPAELQKIVDVRSLLQAELDWLLHVDEVESNDQMLQTLITGHAIALRTLLTFGQVPKDHPDAHRLVRLLVDDFLFTSSRQLNTNARPEALSVADAWCQARQARLAALGLLAELCRNCVANLQVVVELLTTYHNTVSETMGKWEFLPPVEGRADNGYVGLKNAGATCYMNSLLQQFFMNHAIRNAVLEVSDEEELAFQQQQQPVVTDPPVTSAACENVDSVGQAPPGSTFHQLQTIFGHLLDSRLQSYTPAGLWKTFKLWGAPVNVREQQDVLEFFNNFVDQMDEHLKALGRRKAFQRVFGGVFADQKICRPCPHQYTREEDFTVLCVNVRNNRNLQEALEQYVKGDILSGDNAYNCELCDKKVEALKRTCIKTLPPCLAICLKRFEFDWESYRPVKFNDAFEFPRSIDMRPYTVEGLAEADATQAAKEAETALLSPTVILSQPGASQNGGENLCEPWVQVPSVSTTPTPTPAVSGIANGMHYALSGVVVHSGMANAGHYYSYIKIRDPPGHEGPNHGKWFEFNDTRVTEVELTDAEMERQFFGGKNKVDRVDYYNTEHERFWSAYLLFYERVDTNGQLVSQAGSPTSQAQDSASNPITLSSPAEGPERESDDTSSMSSSGSMTNLISRMRQLAASAGQVFVDRMPLSIQGQVQEANVHFMHQRDIFNFDYFNFIRQFVEVQCADDAPVAAALPAAELAAAFLFNTYWHTKKTLRRDARLANLLLPLLQRHHAVRERFVTALTTTHTLWLSEMLLKCPQSDVRTQVARTIFEAIKVIMASSDADLSSVETLMALVIKLLEKEVVDFWKNAEQLFWLLREYLELGGAARRHALGQHLPTRLTYILLGHLSPPNPDLAEQAVARIERQWSKTEMRELVGGHQVMTQIVRGCNLGPLEDSRGHGPVRVTNPLALSRDPAELLPLPPYLHLVLLGPAPTYLNEVMAFWLDTTGVSTLLECLSWNNRTLSMLVVQRLVQHLSAETELKMPCTVLLALLRLADNLQVERLRALIHGERDNGLLSFIARDKSLNPKRAYQYFKFVVELLNRCPAAEQYLKSNRSWSWVVDWLEEQLTYPNQNWPISTRISNDTSTTRFFQRTISAQDTLQQARRFLEDGRSDSIPEDDNECGDGYDMSSVDRPD